MDPQLSSDPGPERVEPPASKTHQMYLSLYDQNTNLQTAERWFTPLHGQPQWMPHVSEPVDGKPHHRLRYRLFRRDDLVHWLSTEIWIAEGRGNPCDVDRAVLFDQARLVRKLPAWDKKTARLFACHCAEHVLPIYEYGWPDDVRPRAAIKASRKYAEDQITLEALKEYAYAANIAAELAGKGGTPTGGVAEAAYAALHAAHGDAGIAASYARLAKRAHAIHIAGRVADQAEAAWQTEQLFERIE